MLLTEHQRFTTLWSSVMTVNCTLLSADESFGQLCEKIQTVFILVRYGKIQHISKEQGISPWTSTVFSNTALKRTPFAYLIAHNGTLIELRFLHLH